MWSLTTKIPKSMRSINSDMNKYFVQGMFRHIAPNTDDMEPPTFMYTDIANIVAFRKITGTTYSAIDVLGADGNVIEDYARTRFQLVEIYNQHKDDMIYVSSSILVNVRYARYIRQHPHKPHRRSMILSVGTYSELPISVSMFYELRDVYPIKVENYELKQFKYSTCKPATEQSTGLELRPITRRRHPS